jgi:hypothetical protein
MVVNYPPPIDRVLLFTKVMNYETIIKKLFIIICLIAFCYGIVLGVKAPSNQQQPISVQVHI